ncbi:MAG: hypothetical protein CVU09_16475 [Bacteroidetes bacterium HGW-Bacteroidetes-4]|jgi:photosystem II stability/assembly factor-like uncharacterized protein|nr:MAG: hypothetical protein CVU09_16475 [Bacteroidetes bacterium HGW-Bacteroidetes-4]
MKKITWTILSGFAAMLILALVFTFQKDKNKNITQEYTPRQIWDMEYQKKKERREKGNYSKTDKPDLFTKYFKDITTQIGKSETNYSMNYKVEQLKQANERVKKLKSAKVQLEWVERGPGNVGGRTRALIVDPDDNTHNTWFAGAATGGIWKTTDGGVTWANLSDQFTNLSVNAIAMAESDRNVIYAGTGESFPGGTYLFGNGIWKSTDKGLSWTQLSSTANDENFGYINRLVIDPADENIVLAATETGIFKTIDGGATWSKVYASSQGVEDLDADPTNFNILFAGEHGVGVLRSVNSGDIWAPSISGLGNGTRFEVAVSPVDHNYVYASVNVSNTVSNVYLSKDNGLTWSKFNNTQAFLASQGDYDNIIAAHPYNADEVYVGGVDVWKLKFNGTIVESEPTVKGAYTVDVDFITWINFSGEYLGGGMSTSDGTNRVAEDWVSVEIRFGAGLSQKAHRFTVPDGSTSGVPAANYTYADYVDVPFQVWDITNNRQLMVSFRDQEKDGAYNLYETTGDTYGTQGREYIFVNSVTYDAANPSSNITVNGGHLYKNLYMFWPVLTPGATWDANNLPTSKIVVEYGTFKLFNGVKTSIADSYGQYSGPNGYDQGAGFGKTLIPGLHPDHHNMALIPTGGGNFIFIDANDGGLGISKDNGATFTMLPNNYRTTQFYGVAKNPEANEYIGGMQDNGTWQSPADEDASAESHYYFRIGGDGFECLWHAKDPNLLLGSVYNNSIRRSSNGGASWGTGSTGMTADDGPFITRLSASKENPDLAFAVGNKGVYRTTTFGNRWAIRLINTNWAISGAVSSSHNVEVSLANGNIVWAGGGMAKDYGLQMQVSTDEGLTFKAVNDYALVPINAYSSGIATHPTDDSTAFVLFSISGMPKVLRTKDLGETWEDISGFGTNNVSSNGFPDVVVHSLVVMPHNTNIIWVGTDIGLFESTDNGETWNISTSGLPPVSVYDMQIVGHQVVLATHGRGIWTVDIPEIDNAPYIEAFVHNSSYNLSLQSNFKVAYDSAQIFIDDKYYETVKLPATGLVDIPVTVNDIGTYSAHLVAYIDQVPFKSNTIDITFDLTSVDDFVSNDAEILVYPNPSKGLIKLKLNESSADYIDVKVFNIKGSLVFQDKVEFAREIPLNLEELKAGNYILEIQTKEGRKSKKITIQ